MEKKSLSSTADKANEEMIKPQGGDVTQSRKSPWD
jgi:hypothetical protein